MVEQLGVSSVDHNQPRYPWRQSSVPMWFVLLGVFVTMISGCECSCNLLNKNNNASLDLEFTSHGINKLHVSEKGFQAIDCGVVNYCQIRWYRHGNGGVLHEYPAWDLGPFSVFLLEYNNQSLRFKSADQVAAGNYTCIASNATHSISRTTILKVDEPFWTGLPLQLQEDLCQNQTASPGANVTFFCTFYIGTHVGKSTIYWQRPNASLPEEESPSCGYSSDWLNLAVLNYVSRYVNYHQQSFYRSRLYIPFFGNETPSVSSRLEVFNVSEEEGYGLYCVIINYDGLWSRAVLTLSPTEELLVEATHYKRVVGIIFVSPVALVVLAMLLWKVVALDVKFWYKIHFSQSEENDGKTYDAYISYSWTDYDRQFVLKVIMPYLQSYGYRVFVPEIHTIPSNVFLEELNRAMAGSRRCVVLITPNFTHSESEHSKFEVEIAAEAMSADMTRRIVPVLLGVSACVDSSPLFGSEPITSSSSTCSSGQESVSSSSMSDTSSKDQSLSSRTDDLSSATDSSGRPPLPHNPSCKIARINFNYNPLLGQFVKALKPLRVHRSPGPPMIKNHTHFLKQLRLRMPKPPAGAKAVTLNEMVAPHQRVVETVAHTDVLVDNEQVPDWGLEEDEFGLQELPRFYPVLPDPGLFHQDPV